MSLIGFSSITTALAFYIIYHEKLDFKDWIGMLCLMASILIIGLSKSKRDIEESNSGGINSLEEDIKLDFSSSLIPLGLVFITCLLMTLSSVLQRAAVNLDYK